MRARDASANTAFASNAKTSGKDVRRKALPSEPRQAYVTASPSKNFAAQQFRFEIVLIRKNSY
jgi:hypothetical protein